MKSIKNKKEKIVKCRLCEIAKARKIPGVVRTVNGFTPEFEKRMIKETECALKHGKSYTSIEELHDDILGILKK